MDKYAGIVILAEMILPLYVLCKSAKNYKKIKMFIRW